MSDKLDDILDLLSWPDLKNEDGEWETGFERKVYIKQQLRAYILAEIQKAKPEKKDDSMKSTQSIDMSMMNTAFNEALDDYEQALIGRFGAGRTDSQDSASSTVHGNQSDARSEVA